MNTNKEEAMKVLTIPFSTALQDLKKLSASGARICSAEMDVKKGAWRVVVREN